MTIYGMCEHYDCSLLNNTGYCQATACMNHKYNGWDNKEATINNGRNVSPDEFKAAVERYRAQHITNADRIRVMTDEELAEWVKLMVCKYRSCGNCPMNDWCTPGRGIADWLKQEATE